MEIFLLGYALFIILMVALAAWRRRGVLPYEDRTRTVSALRDKHRIMWVTGMSGEIVRERRMKR
jgi:hypothetical protein